MGVSRFTAVEGKRDTDSGPRKGVTPLWLDLDLEHSQGGLVHDHRCCTLPAGAPTHPTAAPSCSSSPCSGQLLRVEESEWLQKPRRENPFWLETPGVFCESKQLAGGSSQWRGAAGFAVVAKTRLYLWSYILQASFYPSDEKPRAPQWAFLWCQLIVSALTALPSASRCGYSVFLLA